MSVHLSKVSSGLTSLQISAARPGADALLDSEPSDGFTPDSAD
jgi:hypothetical protein